MAHVKPHWQQPSHPEIQDVRYGDEGFTTKSYSKVDLPPLALFSKMSGLVPRDLSAEPTYATVQLGMGKHLNLNSDLLYINHSCEPSLIFDTGNLNIIVGPKGLKVGDELTFFYPSTEWHMSQPFDCLCAKPTCRGRIAGAKDMPKTQMDGLWVNGHILEMLNPSSTIVGTPTVTPLSNTTTTTTANSTSNTSSDITAVVEPLKDALMHAEKVVEAARNALQAVYVEKDHHAQPHPGKQPTENHAVKNSRGGIRDDKTIESDESKVSPALWNSVEAVTGSENRGVSSREMSGEMGGDTKCLATAAVAK